MQAPCQSSSVGSKPAFLMRDRRTSKEAFSLGMTRAKGAEAASFSNLQSILIAASLLGRLYFHRRLSILIISVFNSAVHQ
jgi:hypothetical protein